MRARGPDDCSGSADEPAGATCLVTVSRTRTQSGYRPGRTSLIIQVEDARINIGATKRLCRPSSLFSFPGTSFSRSMNRQKSSFSGPWSCHDRVDARSGSRTLRAGYAGCLWQSLSRTAHPRCLIAWPGRGNGHSNRTRKHPKGASFPVRSRAMIAWPVRSGSTSYDVSRHIYPLH